jgi:hypothetical protein
MNTLIYLLHHTNPVLHACVAALAMLGLGLGGMDASFDKPLYSESPVRHR